MTDWLTAHKVPIGKAAKAVVDFLTDHASAFFDGIAFVLSSVIDALLWVLQSPPPLLVVAVAAAATHAMHRKAGLSAFVAAGLLLIINQGYWEETTGTLALVLASATLCMTVGVPLGIAAAHRPWLYSAMRPLLDLMQTIPTFVYLIPALVLFGLGEVPGLIATVIFAIAAPIRLTVFEIADVDIAAGVFGLAAPVRDAVDEVAFVNNAVRLYVDPVAIGLAFAKLAFVSGA